MSPPPHSPKLRECEGGAAPRPAELFFPSFSSTEGTDCFWIVVALWFSNSHELL